MGHPAERGPTIIRSGIPGVEASRGMNIAKGQSRREQDSRQTKQ